VPIMRVGDHKPAFSDKVKTPWGFIPPLRHRSSERCD